MDFVTRLRLGQVIGKPDHAVFWRRDVNPVSGHTKRRQYHNPNQAAREAQTLLIAWLAGCRMRTQAWLPSATGCEAGCTTLGHLLPHLGQRFFYIVDVARAYFQITAGRLGEALLALDDPELDDTRDGVAEALWNYGFMLTPAGQLPTGGIASPALFNIYVEHVVNRQLRELCSEQGVTMTHYLDDWVFSRPADAGPFDDALRRSLREPFVRAGLSLNHRKCQVVDLQHRPIVIVGIGLRWPDKIFLPRRYLTMLRGRLHTALRTGTVSPQLNGMVNVFWQTTNPGRLRGLHRRYGSTLPRGSYNRLERKIVRLIERYRYLRLDRRRTERRRRRREKKAP